MGHDAKRRGLRSPCATPDDQLAIVPAQVRDWVAQDEALSASAGALFDHHQHLATHDTITQRWIEPNSSLPTIEVSFRVNGVRQQLTIEMPS